MRLHLGYYLLLFCFCSHMAFANKAVKTENLQHNKLGIGQGTSINYHLLLSLQEQPLLWFKQGKPNIAALSLLSLLGDLGVASVSEVAHNNPQLADESLTERLLYIANLFNGYQIAPLENPQQDIVEAVKNNNLAWYVDTLLPQFEQVVHLRRAIAHYRKLIAATATQPWPQVESNLSLSLGRGHQSVIKLRYILTQLGDLAPSQLVSYRQHIVDPDLIAALKQFQRRHQLKANGKLTPQTINALNRPLEERLQILQINLWRWLSLPSEPPPRYIMVNIPAFKLTLFAQQQPALTMKVIVGTPKNPTPIMVSEIHSITVNPLWTPTYNIVHNELLPANANTPGYLRRQNFKLAKGVGAKKQLHPMYDDNEAIKKALANHKIVQASGPNNALGKYRFNMKNHHAVYLHDTPTKSLFNRRHRALSHGCVRLADATTLAEKLLAPLMSDSTLASNLTKRQREFLVSSKKQYISLQQVIPLYLTYQTVEVTPQGIVYWKNDIYQLDKNPSQ
jgi:L,D-transpeptidase YcbB